MKPVMMPEFTNFPTIWLWLPQLILSPRQLMIRINMGKLPLPTL